MLHRGLARQSVTAQSVAVQLACIKCKTLLVICSSSVYQVQCTAGVVRTTIMHTKEIQCNIMIVLHFVNSLMMFISRTHQLSFALYIHVCAL